MVLNAGLIVLFLFHKTPVRFVAPAFNLWGLTRQDSEVNIDECEQQNEQGKA
jgi:hypothetical protein